MSRKRAPRGGGGGEDRAGPARARADRLRRVGRAAYACGSSTTCQNSAPLWPSSCMCRPLHSATGCSRRGKTSRCVRTSRSSLTRTRCAACRPGRHAQVRRTALTCDRRYRARGGQASIDHGDHPHADEDQGPICALHRAAHHRRCFDAAKQAVRATHAGSLAHLCEMCGGAPPRSLQRSAPDRH